MVAAKLRRMRKLKSIKQLLVDYCKNYSYICLMKSVTHKKLFTISSLWMHMRRKIIHFTQHNSFSLSSLKLNKIVIIFYLVILTRHLKLWYGNQTWVLFQGGSLCTALSVSKPQFVQFLVPCSKIAGGSTWRVFENVGYISIE